MYIFLGKRFRKQGHTLSGIPSGWAAGDQSCESMLGTQTHKQGRDLSLLWLLASLQAGLPSLPLCLSPVPEPRQVEGLICSHTVFPAHLQDACLACWLRQAPNRCTCSSQHRGAGLGGLRWAQLPPQPLSIPVHDGCAFVPLSSFPILLGLRDNPGAMRCPKMVLNLVPSRASLRSR